MNIRSGSANHRIPEDGAAAGQTMRLRAALTTLGILLIAGSVGVVLRVALGFSSTDATVAALAVLMGLALLNTMTARKRDRSEVGGKIADLARGTADLARQVAEINAHLVGVEAEVANAREQAHFVMEPIVTELESLGSLLKRLGSAVSARESAPANAGAEPKLNTRAAGENVANEPRESGTSPTGDGRVNGMARQDRADVIRCALAADRIRLCVEPIVTLPQRKVRYYEALLQLGTEQGEQLVAAELAACAEGAAPGLDDALLTRCIKLVRRLHAKNRDIGLFCTISRASLSDPRFFSELLERMQANRALTSSLVLEVSRATVRAMGPVEHERLAALADLGFGFSLHRLADLRVEPRELSERGFRFLKAPASMLLRWAGPATEIDPADFSDVLGRFGIDLIAEKIESENTVFDLLNFDVRFGQGPLFSPPRPVRDEVLQTSPEPPPDGTAVPLAAAEAPGAPMEIVLPPGPESPGSSNAPSPPGRGGASVPFAQAVVHRG
jgi:cyclic-di-GMP phosphodiesterase, flagellum assembly factor TipF